MSRARRGAVRRMPGALSRGDEKPLYLQIYERVRHGIATGANAPGSRLPSTRELASELGVARGTVEDAYGLLVSEGYIERHGQSGSIVARALIASTGARRMLGPVHSRRSDEASRDAGVWSADKPFQPGLPALDAFPNTTWARLVARQARLPLTEMSLRGGRGHPKLRDAVAQYLGLSRGVACSPEQVLITNGYQGAIDLICRTLLKDGDEVWLEEPGYVCAREVVAAARAKIVPVSVDAQGMRVSDGIASAPEARLAVVTPAHQSPLCVALSLPRRVQLLEWARAHGSFIVEDDYDGEFHYGGRPLPALKSLDRQDRVIYAGSFSKTLLPNLRLGYVVVPASILERLIEAAEVTSAAAGESMQLVAAEFIQSGLFVRHLHRMRRLYAGRRAALGSALREVFGDRAVVDSPDGGMQLLVRFPARTSDIHLPRDVGLGVQPLSLTYHGRERKKGLILGFANVREETARYLARQLAKVVSAGR